MAGRADLVRAHLCLVVGVLRARDRERGRLAVASGAPSLRARVSRAGARGFPAHHSCRRKRGCAHAPPEYARVRRHQRSLVGGDDRPRAAPQRCHGRPSDSRRRRATEQRQRSRPDDLLSARDHRLRHRCGLRRGAGVARIRARAPAAAPAPAHELGRRRRLVGLVVVWRFTGWRTLSHEAEERARDAVPRCGQAAACGSAGLGRDPGRGHPEPPLRRGPLSASIASA